MLPYNLVCDGRIVEKPSARIVGGEAVASSVKYPWMVSIMQPWEMDERIDPFCGGSLISNEYVLTAAHCVYGTSEGMLRVLIGHNDITKAGPADLRRVAEIIKHENYADDIYTNDIALIRLQEPVKYSDKIKPICLDSTSQAFDKLWVIGFGQRNSSVFSKPTILHEVSFPKADQAACEKEFADYKVGKNQICAGVKGKDPCTNDSGGPLMGFDEAKKSYALVGLVSFGSTVCAQGNPTVYTRVSAFNNWVKDHTNGLNVNCA